MPPRVPIGPKNALQFPWNTVGPGPGHCTPLKVVLPVPVQPVKSPVSKLPLTSTGWGAACAGPTAATANPTAATKVLTILAFIFSASSVDSNNPATPLSNNHARYPIHQFHQKVGTNLCRVAARPPRLVSRFSTPVLR